MAALPSVPVSNPWSVTRRGALVQTNRQRQLLASEPSWGQEHSGGPGQGALCSSVLAAGRGQASQNRWLLVSHWEKEREGCAGDDKGLSL